MTDREKLVELIHEVAEEIMMRGVDWYYTVNSDTLVDHLIANGVMVNDDCKACGEATHECIVGLQEKIAEMRKKLEWISVEDRLPEDEQEVIGWEGSYAKILYYDAEFNEWNDENGWRRLELDKFTHWMPLPEPPKKEENSNE